MGSPRRLVNIPIKFGTHLSPPYKFPGFGFRSVLAVSLSSSTSISECRFTNVGKIKAKVQSKLVIKSAWVDVVTTALRPGYAAKLDFDESNGLLQIVSESGSVDLSVPERINIEIDSLSGDVEIQGKLEGDVKIRCKHGNISLEKLRGERVYLNAKGHIDVSKHVEGTEIEIDSKSFHAKRVMGDVISVKCKNGVEIVSSYAEKLNISTHETVTLGSVHSNLYCSAKALAIHGMNGAVVTTCKTNVEVYFDTFAENSCSVIRSIQGNINVAIPQLSETESNVTLEIIAKKLEQQDDAFKVVASIYEERGSVSVTKMTIMPLMLLGSNGGNLQAPGSGKINIQEAAKEIYGKQKTCGDAPQIIQVEALQGTIKLEQLDWMGRIKKQFL